MRPREYPIIEYDDTRPAIIEPSAQIAPIDIAEHAILCFFGDVVTALGESEEAREVHTLGSEAGHHPVYERDVGHKRVAFMQPGVGAPFAAAMLEELIALGCRKFVACGGAGVLDSEIAVGHLLVPTAAIRDEGTSYHYLPPNREVDANEHAVAAVTQTLDAHGVPHRLVKTWTTDAYYRETRDRANRRREEGCLTVEMEAAALLAVASFRVVPLGIILYEGDNISADEWDSREWQDRTAVRERVFELAVEACLRL